MKFNRNYGARNARCNGYRRGPHNKNRKRTREGRSLEDQLRDQQRLLAKLTNTHSQNPPYKNAGLKNQVEDGEEEEHEQGESLTTEQKQRMKSIKENIARLKEQVEKSQRAKKERKNAVRYKRVKFFDRQKLTRLERKLKRKIHELQRQQQQQQQEETRKDDTTLELERLQRDLKRVTMDQLYHKHWPNLLPYQSLFPKRVYYIVAIEEGQEAKRRREEGRQQIFELLGMKDVDLSLFEKTEGNCVSKLVKECFENGKSYQNEKGVEDEVEDEDEDEGDSVEKTLEKQRSGPKFNGTLGSARAKKKMEEESSSSSSSGSSVSDNDSEDGGSEGSDDSRTHERKRSKLDASKAKHVTSEKQLDDEKVANFARGADEQLVLPNTISKGSNDNSGSSNSSDDSSSSSSDTSSDDSSDSDNGETSQSQRNTNQAPANVDNGTNMAEMEAAASSESEDDFFVQASETHKPETMFKNAIRHNDGTGTGKGDKSKGWASQRQLPGEFKKRRERKKKK